MTAEIDQEMPRDMQIVKEVARIIWPEAMDGKTENGRLDEAVALDKAESAFDEVIDHATGYVKGELYESLKDYSLIKAEHVSDLRDAVLKGDLGAVRKVIDRLEDTEAFIDNLEFTYQD